MKQLEDGKRKWSLGYLLLEDGHCLIEDQTGDVMMIESLPNQMIYLQEEDGWTKGELNGTTILQENGRFIDVQGGETIQYARSVPKGLLDLLLTLNEDVFNEVIIQLESFGFSVYDCIFSYFNQMQNVNKGVSFFQFSTDEANGALQYHIDRSSGTARFEWTTADGKRHVSIFQEKS
ncbi:DUF2777 family protein [Bacillus sp. NPDC077027]|uniref:DUF2777 family protein n=1 Tax=Bacillus sp. NPDC077027 TaxID=3390548 RepID=UPI003D0194ED